MRKSYRSGRMGEEIRRIISECLLRELKDPGIPPLTCVSDVRVSNDGSFAAVYLSVPGGFDRAGADEREKREALDAFNRAKGLLRREIGARLRLKHTPELTFKIDESEVYGRHIEGIIARLGIERGADDPDDSDADEAGGDEDGEEGARDSGSERTSGRTE